MRASADFRLESGPSRIDVRPAATWLRPTGAAVTAVGVATVAVGAFVLGSTLCGDPHSDDCGSSSVRGVGATILSLGGIALFAGIMTLVRGGTDVLFVRDPAVASWGPGGLTF
jgi:hypothetical protein